jgi:predicted Fe-Mo cluster-binding NifX family protein
MKIGIPATSDSLEANLDPRFGRCQYFLIVDSDSMDYSAVQNDSINAAHGAGIQAAQIIANMGVDVVITGNVGPNAFNVLFATGIKIVTGASGSVREAIEKFKSGQLKEVRNPTVGGHFGMGKGSGRQR